MAPANVGGHHPVCWGPNWNKKVEERGIWYLLVLRHPSSALRHGHSWFSSFQTKARTHTFTPLILRPSDLG